MKIKKIFFIIFCLILLIYSFNSTVKASPLPPKSLPIDNVFKVPTGADSYVDGNITVITEDGKNKVGSIFSTESNKIDLTKSFHAEMYVYLGNKNDLAADGMTFVMHADQKMTEKFSAGLGEQLGVYAKVGSNGDALKQQILNSFAIEFDTYYNGYGLDTDVNKNSDKGHIAYSFPDKKSSYNLGTDGNVKSLKHQSIYYPTEYLSNDSWHLFVINWDAEKKEFQYTFDDSPAVTVPINPISIFGTNSVYWGFTGSTGDSSQESKVAFKQIPGLVNVSSSIDITKDGVDVTDTGISAEDGDVKVQYKLTYNGGKQDLKNPTIYLLIDSLLSFKPGTLTVNGTTVTDDYFKKNFLTYKLPNDMTNTNNTVTISFDATPTIDTDKDTKTKISSAVNADNFSDALSIESALKKVNIITSSYFENQSWLINEINRQLNPKKIDIDVYKSDLAKITNINLTSSPNTIGEYIPKTIDSLINLTYLLLANQKLSSILPEELGNLSKLTTLSIYGNTFEGEIPQSIGKLEQLKLIAFDDNNLKGIIPANIASLPNLSQIYLNGNRLSGQLPDFKMNMTLINIRDNQITSNLSTVPSFLTSAKNKSYTKTFISGLKLTGNSRISVQSENIKPFDELDKGYFDLKAIFESKTIDLFEEHSYIIKNAVDGTIYYSGKKDKTVTIPYQKDIRYMVILDNAEKNPNNVFMISGKERELKFEETPISISLKIKVGDKNQPVIPEGNLTIFDDRDNKEWKLSITTSELKNDQRKLQGEYSYIGKDGISKSIVTGQKFTLETGISDSINEVIPLSNFWGNEKGLMYSVSSSNLIGNYQGDVVWTLEDAP